MQPESPNEAEALDSMKLEDMDDSVLAAAKDGTRVRKRHARVQKRVRSSREAELQAIGKALATHQVDYLTWSAHHREGNPLKVGAVCADKLGWPGLLQRILDKTWPSCEICLKLLKSKGVSSLDVLSLEDAAAAEAAEPASAPETGHPKGKQMMKMNMTSV